MAKKMLIDATHLEETRVVVADGNRVDEFDFESINKRQLAGNIYLAKVTRVEPSLQAAFVEYGGNRHGFLAFSEVHPDYYQIPIADREALLAEDAAERALSDDHNGNDGSGRRNRGRNNRGNDTAGTADGGEDQEKPKTRSRRGKRRARGAQAETSTELGEVKGLEVIELSEQTTADDAAEPGDTPDAEVKGLEIANLHHDESNRSEADAIEADQPEGDQDEATPVEADGPGLPPKSIAESAGLDDDESVSEDVREAVADQAEATEAPAETPKAKPARKRVRKKAAPKTPATADDDSKAEAPEAEIPANTTDTSATENTAPNDPTAPPDGEATDTPSMGDDAKSEADPDDKPKNRRAAKPARTRKRRTRAKDEDQDDDTADTADTPAEAVDSVGADDLQEEEAKVRAKRRRHYKIQDVLKVRQIMLVQVVKEERGNKGAALTTYLSLAGRYCVLMPNTARGGGISRKITNASDRKRLREITDEIDVPTGMGLIVRTAGADRTRPEIKRDYEFLERQWEQIRELTLKSIAPTLIYEEGSLIKRSIRDLYSKEIDTILVEGEEGYREAKDYMKMLMPSHAKNVQLYQEQIPLYIRYQVESYLNGMFNPVVQLRSGGYIVIGITEALVAIDVNSGRSTKESSIEETALKTNLEAAEEVARQLRLRDLAGLIVIDFIDMDDNRNNRAVEKRMKDRLKSDRARIQIGRISAFGLMEMSRQRLRPGMLEATTQPCRHCQGQGIVRSDENLSLSILREIEEEGVRGRSAEVTVTMPVNIANYIMNMKRAHLSSIEARYGLVVTIYGDPALISPEFRIERSKTRSRQIELPDTVITAESVAADSSLETAEVAPDLSAAEKPSDSSDESGEGKSRRRRGRRGGQRRQHDETENAGEDSASRAGETAQDADASTGAEKSAGSDKPSGERRSRRRRGGRGRSRRRDGEANTAATAGEATVEETIVVEDAAAQATEMAPGGDGAEVPDQPVPDAAVPAEIVTEESVAEPAATEVFTEPTTEPEITHPEPEVIPELEPVGATPTVQEIEPQPEPEPAEPTAPKRRGWWSRG